MLDILHFFLLGEIFSFVGLRYTNCFFKTGKRQKENIMDHFYHNFGVVFTKDESYFQVPIVKKFFVRQLGGQNSMLKLFYVFCPSFWQTLFDNYPPFKFFVRFGGKADVRNHNFFNDL